MAAGTLETVVVRAGGGGRGVSRPALRGVRAARDADTVGVVAGQLDLLNVVVQNPLEQLVGQDFGGVRPSILFGSDTDQAVCFGGLLEILVVVCTAPAAILDVCNLLVILMTHFVQEGGNGAFDRAVKRTCANVDLFPAFALDTPCIVEGVVSIGAGGGLDGDDRAFQYAVEEVAIQLVVQLFKVACKSAVLAQLFHWFIPLLKWFLMLRLGSEHDIMFVSTPLVGGGQVLLPVALVGV